jgi:hypothetical protein
VPFAAHPLLLRLPACFLTVHVYSGAMDDTPGGLTDKLYWRKARGQWHCFKKIAQVCGYVSLCQRQEIAMVRGREISPPEAALRCGVCDGPEMERRGWEDSGPVSLRRAGREPERRFSRARWPPRKSDPGPRTAVVEPHPHQSGHRLPLRFRAARRQIWRRSDSFPGGVEIKPTGQHVYPEKV